MILGKRGKIPPVKIFYGVFGMTLHKELRFLVKIGNRGIHQDVPVENVTILDVVED